MECKITAIIVQKRNRERVNIYLGEEYAFGLARIVAAWLQVGPFLSEENIAELQVEDAREVAYLQALKFLDYRDRSIAEVRRHLRKRDIPEIVIDDVIERLQRGGLVDDQQFAHNWVENRMEFRPRGRRALAHELQQKGISAEIIQEAIDQCNDEVLAYQAAIKQSKKFNNLDWNDYRKKMFGFLARRGFSYEVTAPVITRVWEELHLQNFTEDSYTNKEVDA